MGNMGLWVKKQLTYISKGHFAVPESDKLILENCITSKDPSKGCWSYKAHSSENIMVRGNAQLIALQFFPKWYFRGESLQYFLCFYAHSELDIADRASRLHNTHI